jgi:hypothetical protein
MPGVKRSEMQATAWLLVQPAARSFSSTATWKFATVSWDFSASVSCSEYGQRALTPAAEANGAERVSCEVGTAELGPAEYVVAGAQSEVIEPLTDAAELITGAAELMIGAAELLTGAAEMMSEAAERMSGAAKRMTGAAERMAGAAERMVGAAERMAGTAEWITGAAERMTGAAGLMTGVPLAGLTIGELAAEFLTDCRDTRFTTIFLCGSRLEGYTGHKERKL